MHCLVGLPAAAVLFKSPHFHVSATQLMVPPIKRSCRPVIDLTKMSIHLLLLRRRRRRRLLFCFPRTSHDEKLGSTLHLQLLLP